MRTAAFTSIFLALAGCISAQAGTKPDASAPAGVKAGVCAPTVEDAVRTVVGIRPMHAKEDGYTAQSLITDAVLHRAWVRVARCNDPAGPMMLVELEVPLSGPPVQNGNSPASVHAAPAVKVHRGDHVHVTFVDDSTSLDLQGVADADAAEGQQVSVSLPRAEGQMGPERQLRGTVNAQGVVEMN